MKDSYVVLSQKRPEPPAIEFKISFGPMENQDGASTLDPYCEINCNGCGVGGVYFPGPNQPGTQLLQIFYHTQNGFCIEAVLKVQEYEWEQGIRDWCSEIEKESKDYQA